MHQPSYQVVRIRLQGEFDISDRERLTEMLRPAEIADTAIIDMSETTFIDTTALGCLIHLRRQLAGRSGAVHLVGLRPNIRKVFVITGLDQIFDISDFREAPSEVANVALFKGHGTMRASPTATP